MIMKNEEKAKRYDEALKVAVAAHKDEDKHLKATLERIFPELAEHEDKRIREKLIDTFNFYDPAMNSPFLLGIHKKDILAWFEKQGEQKSAEWHKGDEQNLNACLGYIPDEYLRRWLMDVIHVKYDKPTDKVEPKFKNGQWIVWQDKCYKVNYNGCGYELVDQNGLSILLEYGTIDENAHLWTIQDAKPGDVLAKNDVICIFKRMKLYHYDLFDSYCELYIEGNQSLGLGFDFNVLNFYPATKEQRDTLMKVMADAGYTFDFEKKEPKKIEQMSSWSEEDKNFMYDTLSNLTELKDRYGEGYGNVGKCIGWLKTLKERYTWKPSDEQMKALRDLNLTGNISYAGQGQTLKLKG